MQNKNKKKSSLMRGGGTRWQPKPSSPLPQWGLWAMSQWKVIKNGKKRLIWANPQTSCGFPRGLVIQVSKSTYLFPVSCKIKYAAYIVNSNYISCGEGKNFLIGVTSFQRATSPWRFVIKNKN